MTLLKINRLLPIYISIVPLKFEVDIQSQSKVRVRKPKNPIWPPGGHFESDIAENQWASAYGHHQHAYEIWNWNSTANLTYAPETMSSTDRRTDGRTDKVNPVYPPSNFVGRGYKKIQLYKVQCQKSRQFAMAETYENWLGLVKSCIYYAYETHEIYPVLPHSMDFKAPLEIHWVRQYLVNKVLFGIKNL